MRIPLGRTSPLALDFHMAIPNKSIAPISIGVLSIEDSISLIRLENAIQNLAVDFGRAALLGQSNQVDEGPILIEVVHERGPCI
jgi:hypothetical protein